MALYRNGKQSQALDLMVDAYKERLYWHIRKIVISHHDTDEILQDTFVKAWRGLQNFKEAAQLYTWLYRIATNESLNFLDRKKRRNWLNFSDNHEFLSAQLHTSPIFEAHDPQEIFKQAVEKLPEKQRIVFNMRYFDEIPYEEMSEILQTSVGALKASYHHAVKKIEKFVEQQ